VPDAWWDSEDIPVLQEGIRSGNGYEGTDEYQPAGSDRYSLPESAPQIAMLDPESGNVVPANAAQISITRWSAEDRDFSVDSANGVALAPRLLHFPPWTLRMDGQIARADSLSQDGQLLVPVPAGKRQIKLHLGRTWDRTIGAVISLLTAFVLVLFAVIVPRRKPPTSP
jgi:hypothetical protein